MRRPNGLIIAIDGVVGSGKTATARLVAEKLGYRHLDTGAMYRAVTLAATRSKVAATDTEELASLLATVEISLPLRAAEGRLPHVGGESPRSGDRVLLNGEDVTEAIRRPEVTRQIGAYADLPLVRRALVAQQQQMGAEGGVVAEGRDTGTVVFPDAEFKVRMVAALTERARRRHRELIAKGVSLSFDEVLADVGKRDIEDAQRDYGVAGIPADSVEVDTTDMTLEQQVDHIVDLARQRGA